MVKVTYSITLLMAVVMMCSCDIVVVVVVGITVMCSGDVVVGGDGR